MKRIVQINIHNFNKTFKSYYWHVLLYILQVVLVH